MVETNNNSKKTLRKFSFQALKAAIKGGLIYAIYFVLWTVIAPISQIVPGLHQMIETFVTVYIVFVIVEEFTSGTMYHYFFNVGRTLFVIGYLLGTLNSGIFSITFKNINLIVDLRSVLEITMLLSLLELAKTVLQTIDYMNEKAEIAHT
jgi:hypothetical protein